MYQILIFLHSSVRWLVLFSLILAIGKGSIGILKNKDFSESDNKIRHITATISHIQLILGYFLYFNSPLIKYFTSHFKTMINNYSEITFFGLFHMILMFISILIITIGSALTKRKETSFEKFKTMTTWYLVALVIILISIPWPFSPFAQRPYHRLF